jgi:hypothetical protein
VAPQIRLAISRIQAKDAAAVLERKSFPVNPLKY